MSDTMKPYPQHPSTRPILIIEGGGAVQMTPPEFVRVVWIPRASTLTPSEIATRADSGEFTTYPVRIDRMTV